MPFKQRYYRFWDSEDLPTENTFDKYQVPYFDEKEYDVEVSDGQLNIDFQGENWGCCVSAIVVFPTAQGGRGRRFLDFVQARRRFHFDNYFKRTLHAPDRGPAAADRGRTARGLRPLLARLDERRLLQRPALQTASASRRSPARPSPVNIEPVTFSVAAARRIWATCG